MQLHDHQNFIHPDQMWREVGLKAGQTVVHLGVGPGFYLIPAAKQVGESGAAIGVDVLPDMLQTVDGTAAESGLGGIVRTIRANIELPRGSTLEDNLADWVLVANILHQSEPKAILTEAARVVKPTGTIVAIEWTPAASPLGPPTDQRVPRETVIQTASELGLAVTREWQPSPYHYGLLLQQQTGDS